LGKIYYFYISNGEFKEFQSCHSDEITELKLNPLKGNLMASASKDGTIKIWDLLTFEIVMVVM